MFKVLCVPLKNPSEIDIKPLANLIQSTYTNSLPNKFNYLEAVAEFSKQRNRAILKFYEKFESSLEVVYSYYDQLCALEIKLPVNEIQIPFKWQDAFGKGSIFGGKISLTLTSFMYEKICVIFNIAALQSSVAAIQHLDSDEGLKLATKLFQQSAGIFNYLKGAISAVIASDPTPDLNQETLSTLSSLMIAQAQEVFIMKAIKDDMKDQVIAKLCCQCEEMYAEVLRGMQLESIRNLWDKEWIPIVAGKQAGFHALTQWYQSLFCRANKQIGEEIARLRWAIELFKSAQSRCGNAQFLGEFVNGAKRNLAEALKNNEFIYNEIIPERTSLKTPGKAQLAKALPIPSPMSVNFKDIFEELTPVELHRALLASEVKKKEIVNLEISKLREETQTLNAVLARLNLPAAIETNNTDTGLPTSLMEKSKNVRSMGGIEAINILMNELPELLNRNREILDETERLLDEEHDSDNQLRLQFKERWTRILSEKLTGMFRTNAKKYREVINNAIEADKIVKKKFEHCSEGIRLLSMSLEQIQKEVPKANASIDPNSSSVQKLNSLMYSVDKIKTERDIIESKLNSTIVNTKHEFLRALVKDGAIDEPSISSLCIKEALGPLQVQVKESIEQQQILIKSIQDAHAAFTCENGNNVSVRDALYSELASSYDCFINLLGNLKEGTKFYNDLTQLLVVFQNKISDFCFARKTEKDELLKDLTIESSRNDSGPVPAALSHASTTGSDSFVSSLDLKHALPRNIPYPKQVQGMPMPHETNVAAAHSSYTPPPMPQSYNPYATLPYTSNAYQYTGFLTGPLPSSYGTYPGTYTNEQGGNLDQHKW